jgi:hypothetical protein
MTQVQEPECAFGLGDVNKLLARANIFGLRQKLILQHVMSRVMPAMLPFGLGA